MRTSHVIAAAIAGTVLFLWIKSSVGAADENQPPQFGASFGPIQVLTPVY
jgi:hypothetical protein